MSKVLISPIEKWPGSVTIADPLTIPQAQAIEAGLQEEPEPKELQEIREEIQSALGQFEKDDPHIAELMEKYKTISDRIRVFYSVADKIHEPAILACVEKWNLENFSLTSENTLPASPRVETHDLITWLYREIYKVYVGEKEIPNASSPTPTDTQAKDNTPRN